MIFSFAFSLFAKALQAVIAFTTLHHLIATWGSARYGVWATITSLVAYTTMFDLGVGYGIKNRISEAHATGGLADAEAHVRFGLMFYAAASVAMFALGVAVMPYVAPFNVDLSASLLLLGGFVLSFFLSFANIVLQGLGRFKLANAIALVAPASWLAFLLRFNQTVSVPMMVAAAVYAALLVAQGVALVTAVRLVWRFRLGGGWAHSVRLARSLLATGSKFFALQLSALALFYSGTFLAFHYLGPTEVARYDAANKVFSVFTIGYSILVSIAWTEISRAKAGRQHRRLWHIFLSLHAAALLLLTTATTVALGLPGLVLRMTGIALTSRDALPFAVLVGTQSLAFASAVFLNAFERLNGQVACAMLSIPLFLVVSSTALGRGGGIGAIPLAATLAILPAMLYCTAVALRIVRRRAEGTP